MITQPTLTVVVADDDPSTVAHLKPILEREGFLVFVAQDGRQALSMTREHRPHVLILDIEMPRLDGRAVCRELRQSGNRQTSIIMLTRFGDSADTVASLNEGADDYVPKPYDPQVLIARIRAVARRGQAAQSLRDATWLRARGLVLDRLSREVRVNGLPCQLHNLQFRLLEFLMLNPDRPYTRAELLQHVWNWLPTGLELQELNLRRVDSAMSLLRGPLADTDPATLDMIVTEPGRGGFGSYKFVGPVTGSS